jgi:hypothetical protein
MLKPHPRAKISCEEIALKTIQKKNNPIARNKIAIIVYASV